MTDSDFMTARKFAGYQIEATGASGKNERVLLSLAHLLRNGFATRESTSHNLTGSDLGRKIPFPGDPIFMAKWMAFISTFGARYDGNTDLSYQVMTGFGQIVERYLPKNASDTAAIQARWEANRTASWPLASKTIIVAYCGLQRGNT